MSPAPGTSAARHGLSVAVIGAGMGGVLCAIKLREAGMDDVVVYEKADRLGGTWRENTYPGVACDVPSHLYSYSFEPNPDWSHTFAPGDEIERYFERVARRHDVTGLIRFGREVTSCEYADGRWEVCTSTGERDTFDVVIAATGVLHHPKMPDIEGMGDFGGSLFHSARWDHDAPIDGIRMGIIGTGSTAVQIVSAVVPRVEKLSLFQRTPQWILPLPNPAYDEEQRQELRHDPERLAQLRREFSQMFTEGFANAVVDADSPQLHMLEQMCLANLEDNVADPELRERLRPSYRAACKRLVMSADFYTAIQQPNAELVTEGIEGIEKAGVRTKDGRLHELDVLVLATGFKVDSFMRPMSVTGRHGRRLSECWAERPSAYLAVSIPDFPNLFMINGPNGPVGNFSLIEVAELQFAYILQLIDLIRSGKCRQVCATTAALEEFEEARRAQAAHTVWSTGCHSWYLDDRGVPAAWPWTFDRFRQEMASPQLAAYELTG